MSAENVSATPAPAPSADVAQTPATAPVDPVVRERRAATDAETARAPKSLKEKRRVNPNFDAEAWARAGEKVKAKELGSSTSKAPEPTAKAGVPAKGPDGKFLPRDASRKAPAAAKPVPATPDPFGKPDPVSEEPAEAPSEADSADAAPDAPAEAASDPATKRKQLEALAAELGFKIDAKAVTAADRYQLREEQRRRQAVLDQKLQAERGAIEKERTTIAEEGKKAKAFLAALESGDPDAMAQAIGRKDWNAMQEEVLARIANPEYNEIQRLRKELDEDKAARAKAQEEAQARQQEQYRQQAVIEVKRGIATQAAQAKDPLLKAMHADPLFVESLFNIQKANYDEVTQTTLSLEEALDHQMPNGATLRSHMQTLYKALSSAFGAAQAPLPPPKPVASAAPTPKPAPKRAPAPPPAPEYAPPPKPASREQMWRNRAELDRERIERHAAAIKAAAGH